MSYDTLSGANWSDPAQLPDFLWLSEGDTPFLYNDGKGFATIGIGLNLKSNPGNMAIVLGQMSYGGESLFAAAAAKGVSASVVVTTFENIIAATQLTGSADGGNNPITWEPLDQNLSTLILENNLNSLLAGYFGVSFNTLTSNSGSVTFTNFPTSAALNSLQSALQGVPAGTFGNYGAIAGYSANAYSYLTSLTNGHGITVPSENLPPANSGAWEALVSLYFNSQTKTIGAGLLTALADNNLAQAWFQIRYQTNSTSDAGVAARRYAESQLFGLPSTTVTQVIQDYEMLTEHRNSIFSYEKANGTDPDTKSNPTVAAGSIAAETININFFNGPGFQPHHGNPTLMAPILPLPTLASAFLPAAELLLNSLNAISSAVTGGVGDLFDTTSGAVSGRFMVRSTDILMAPDNVDIEDGFAYVVADGYVGPGPASTANHLILGADSVDSVNSNAVTLVAGAGSDILIAGAGQEELLAGSGSDTLIGGQGMGSISGAAGNDTLSGGLGTDTFDFALSSGGALTETIVASKQQVGTIEVSSGNAVTVLGGSAGNQITSVGTGKSWQDQGGVTYSFAPQAAESSIGTLTITGGALGSGVTANQIVIDNFNLAAAESTSGFLGIFLKAHDNSNATANSGIDPPVQPLTEGSNESFTFSVDTSYATATTLTITLTGAAPSDFDVTVGDTIENINANGTFGLTLAAGQTNVAFSLNDITTDDGSSDIANGANLQLSGSLPNPDTLASAAIQSTPLTFSYIPEASDTAPAPQPSSVITGVYNSSSGVTTYTGDGSDDYITATGTANLINAQSSGNDSIVGGGQANTINGSSGNSVYVLTGTSDTVNLGSGFNTVNGGSGHDIIDEGNGDNVVAGNGGTDLILLGNGANQIYAGAQVSLATAIATASSGSATNVQGDLIAVGDGNNTIVGGKGNDLIDAGAGNDVIVMGPGNDIFEGGIEVTQAVANWTATVTPATSTTGYGLNLSGVSAYFENFTDPYPQPNNNGFSSAGPANDTIYGGTGNEFIALGNGNNYVETGNGSDTVEGGMGNDTIIAGSGADTIRGGGGNTYIEGGSGSDYIQGGDGNNTVIGGSGNSTILAANGPNGTTLFTGATLEQNYVDGGSGNDVIQGSAGYDTLIGGSGNTTITGASGYENITGGSGNDLLNGGTGNDTIAAGGAGRDSLFAYGSSSSTTVMYGGIGVDLLVGGSGNDSLYAGDGGVAGAATTVEASLTDATANTTIYGGLGVDLLEGGAGNAVIYGGDGGTSAAPTTIIAYTGNSTLVGGLGTDVIQGGAGSDVLDAGDGGTAAAPTTVVSGTGVSTLNGGVGSSLLQDIASGQDLISSASANDTLIGVGSDTLVAGTGNDLMQANGGSVNFELNAGFGDDTILANGGTENLLLGTGILATDFSGSVTFDASNNSYLTLAGDGGSVEIENGLTGALTSAAYADPSSIPLPTLLTDVLGGDDTVVGPNGHNFIVNLANSEVAGSPIDTDDTISSWGSNATLNGGSGHYYSTGASAVINSSGYNTIVTAGSAATINGGNTGGDSVTLSGANDLEMLAVNGSLYSTVTISGTNDTLISGAGSVGSIVTINNSSAIVQVAAGAGLVSVQSSVSFTAPANASSLTLIGSANISATGNTGADVLTGGAGVDTLFAGAGVDTMISGTGSTTFVVNSASDVVQITAGVNNAVLSSVSYTLLAGVNSLVLTGTAALTGAANSANDTLASNSGVDTLIGGTGNDTFILNNALDVVQDTAGTATIIYANIGSFTLPSTLNVLTLTGTSAIHATGNSGNDSLTGNSGADTLSAGNGNDTLVAGAGSTVQSLVGGSGNDLFVVNSASDTVTVGSAHGTDTIQSSVSFTASSNVANLALLGTSSLVATGNSLANLITANSGSDTLAAGTGIATLVGGASNDTFVVNSGSDVVQDNSTSASNVVVSSVNYTAPTDVNALTLTGTAALIGTANGGNDTLTSNSGADTLVGGGGSDVFIVTNTGVVVKDTSTTASNAAYSSVSYTLPTNVNALTLTGTAALQAMGNTGNDVLTANTGADTLIAGAGTDTLISGTATATDSLVGGTGNDLFIVSYAADTVTVGASHGADTIQSGVSYTLPGNVTTLALTGSANLTGAAVSGNNTIIGNSGSDTLKAGSGSDMLVAGSGVATLIGGVGADTFVINNTADVLQSLSTAGNTVMSSVNYTMATNVASLVLQGSINLLGVGNSVTNEITGNSGNDTLIAGTGTANFFGGLGSDLFIVDNSADTVSDSGVAKFGVDTIQSSVSYTLPNLVNVLVLSGTASLTGTANAAADELVGNGGADTLYGGVGNDTLVAGSGITKLIGGTGNNTFVIDNTGDTVQETVAAQNNVLMSSVSYSLPTNVTTLIFTGSGNLTASANAGNDLIRGNSGADVLNAGSGVDTLAAGSGLATLVGSTGNDTFIVDNTADVVESASSSAHNVLISSATYTLPTNVNVLTLTGIANISGTGNAVADTLTAGAGQDTLIAGSAAATLVGGTGNDTFVVNSATDVVQDSSTTTSNTVQSSVNYTLTANVNSLQLSGTIALTGTANSGNDTLTSNSGVDTLVGGTGNDTFAINNASDIVQDTASSATNVAQASVSYSLTANVNTLILQGTAALKGTANGGADTLSSNSGADTLLGGAGNDTFIVSNGFVVVQDAVTTTSNSIQASVSYTLPTNVNALTLIGTSALSATGNATSDVITANSGTDTLVAGSGTATLIGGSGNDTFIVNSASDVVQDTSTATSNTILSSASFSLAANVTTLNLTGSAALVGTANSGSDTLMSNTGIDTLIGGSGGDLFVINNSADVILNPAANDTVESSVSYSLPAGVNNLILIGSANISGTGNASADTLTAGAGVDTLIGGSGAATMVGGSGADTFVVNNYSDVVEDSSSTTSNTVLSSISYSLPTNVDSLTLTGASALTATGNTDASNVISANSGNDRITGTAYANTITGGAGDDTINAGPEANIIYAGGGGTVATPTYVYGNASGTNVTTESTIYGGSGADILSGGPGSDVIYGGTGTDTIYGGTGFDTLYGAAGDFVDDSLGGYDQVIGGAGSETLDGIGGDTLVAGSGSDVLYDNTETSSPFNIEFTTGFHTDQVNVGQSSNVSLDFGTGIEPSSLSASVVAGSGLFVNSAVADPVLVLQDGTSSISMQSALAPGVLSNLNFADTGTQAFAQFMNTYGPGYESFTDNYDYDGLYATQDYISTGNSKTVDVTTGPSVIWATGSNDDLVDTGIENEGVYGYGSNDTLVGLQVWAAGSNDAITVQGASGSATLTGSGDTLVGVNNQQSYIVEQASDDVQAYGINDSLDAFFNDTVSSSFSQLTLDASVENLSGAIGGAGGTLIAGASFDTLTAGSGADSLIAQSANDVLIGGAGSDTFVLSDPTDSIVFGTGAASVTADFSYTLTSAANTLVLSGSNATGVGNSGNDFLSATGTADTLAAGAGADTLSANTGTLIGGSGNDVFIVGPGSGPGVVIVDTATSATNIVESAQTYFTLPTNVNSLLLTGSGLTGVGNNANDSLVGEFSYDSLVAGSGTDTLVAGSAYDSLVAGSGNDLLVGGSPNDTFVLNSGFGHDQIQLGGGSGDVIQFGSGISESSLTFSALLGTGGAAPSLVITSTSGSVTVQGGLVPGAISSLNFTGGSDYTIPQLLAPTGRATVTGTNGNLILSSNNNDSIVGGTGQDTIDTWGNSDTLNAGTGGTVIYAGGVDDSVTGGSATDTLDAIGAGTTLVGGAGNETFVVNTSTATVQVAAGGHDTVLASVSFTVPTNVSVMTMLGTTGLSATGNSAIDTITGNTGRDTLIGGSAADDLVGKSLADTFVINSAADTVVAASSLANDTLVSSLSNYTLPSNVNTLVLGFEDSGTGNSSNDYLVGGTLGLITAGAGNDTLVGQAHDTLVAGTGQDVLIGDGAAVLISGSAVDTLEGLNGTQNGYQGGNDLYVNNSADVITSLADEDILYTSVNYTLPSAVSYVNGVTWNLTGSANLVAADLSSASAAFTANSGHDTLIGGVGSNSFSDNETGVITAVGGPQSNTFFIYNASDVISAPAGSTDTVYAYVGFSLPANINVLQLGANSLTGYANNGNDTLTSEATGDTLIAGSGNDDLVSGGNSTLVAGSGNDTLAPGNDADMLVFNSGFGNSEIIAPYAYNTVNGPIIDFGAGVSAGSLTVSAALDVTNTAALAISDGTDVITVNGALSGHPYRFSFAGAPALSLGQFLNDVHVTTSSVVGASGNAILEGTASTSLVGGTGNDTIYAAGAADTISGGSGNQLLTAVGTNDLVTGGSASDTLSGAGTNDTLIAGVAVDTLLGGAGASVLFLLNNASDAVQVQSGAGADTVSTSASYSLPTNVATLILTGTAGLTGNANSGADTLTSNSGVDTLIGGSGNDTFVLNNASDVVTDTSTTASNTIQTGISYSLPTHVNTLVLTGTAALVGAANAGADTMISNTGADTLIGNSGNETFFVNNGSDVIQDTSTSATNVIETSVSYTLPTDVNRLVLVGSGNLSATGNSASDSMVGGTGLDTLTAGSATDTLVAGSGLATLIGGAGTDTFVVNNTNDVVQDSIVSSSAVQSSANFTLTTNVNSLTLTGTAGLVGAANGATDTLTSNTALDTLVGGAGSDTFVVNNSGDAIQDTSTTAVNSAKASVSYSLATNVNNLLLTGSLGLVGTGNSGNDSLTGNTGADTLVAGAGVDTLVAGTGVATLKGGAGNDTFVINNASDVVQDTVTSTSNVIRSSVAYSLVTNVNSLVLTGTAALKGIANSGVDTLTANTGADTLVGGSGNDTFVISSTTDVIQDTASSASNAIMSTASYTLPTDVNSLTFSGSTALLGVGNAGNDSMTANTGADTLVAGNGTDTLVSGTSGADSLVGGTGADLFFVNYAGDIVTVGATHGVDTIQSSVSYTTSANVVKLILTGTSALSGTGNTLADTLTANSGADTLTAGTGAATLVGGAGNDTFVINSTSDVIQDTSTLATNLLSSSVNYSLPTNVNRLILTGTSALIGTANSGNDTLTANTGADTLVSGTGTDSMVGSTTGADLFIVNNASDIVTVGSTHGIDTIQSSVSYSAAANVANLTLIGTAALAGIGSTLAGTITANTGNDTLTAGASTDTLVGGSGTDTFVVNSASEVITEATTGTVDTVSSSASYTLPTNLSYLALSGTSALVGTGNTGTDLIVGNTGNDTLAGGTGIAALEGGRTAGSDQIKAASNQAALIAGAGSSTLTGGAYKDFYAAGLVSDSITTGATANVISVNKGDGATALQPTSGATDVLSLGAGIDTESLYFTKTGNNLILTDGVSGDSVTLTNWYVGSADQDVTNLQVVEIASASYNSSGSDVLRNKALEDFNFTVLVTAYNAAGSPASWALSTAMATAQLTSSSTADYGGDLAYYFGLNGNLTGVDLSAVQSTLTNTSYATAAQTIDSFSSITGGSGLHTLVTRPGLEVRPTTTSTDTAATTSLASTTTTSSETSISTPLPTPVLTAPPYIAPLASLPTPVLTAPPYVAPTTRQDVTEPLRALAAHAGTVTAARVSSALADFGGRRASAGPIELRPAVSAASPSAAKSYVDPINLAWTSLHTTLDQIDAVRLGGAESIEDHEGMTESALLASTAASRVRRTIDNYPMHSGERMQGMR